jgi:hypothetical protein
VEAINDFSSSLLHTTAMVSHIYRSELVGAMSDFEEDSQIESNQLVFWRVYKANDIGTVLGTLEGPNIFEVELLLEDNPVVIFVDIDPERLLILDVGGDWINSVYILVGVSIESNLLRNRYSEPEVFAGSLA